MIKQVFSPRLVQAALYAALGLFVLWAAIFIVRPVDSASAAPAPAQSLAPQAYFTCTPIGSAAFSNRIHVQCSTAALTGVYWFAAPNSDSATASRYLSIITSAMIAGRNITIWYEPTANGTAWNCPPSNCLPILGVQLMP